VESSRSDVRKLCSIAVVIFYWILILPNRMEKFAVEKFVGEKNFAIVSQNPKISASLL
jgi:hypothetical protein